MEYYNVITNYTGRLTFMWSGKFNSNSLESQGIFIIKLSGNPELAIQHSQQFYAHTPEHIIIMCVYMLLVLTYV